MRAAHTHTHTRPSTAHARHAQERAPTCAVAQSATAVSRPPPLAWCGQHEAGAARAHCAGASDVALAQRSTTASLGIACRELPAMIARAQSAGSTPV